MDQTWWKGRDSGLGDDDEAVPSKLDKDFTADPPSVIAVSYTHLRAHET